MLQSLNNADFIIFWSVKLFPADKSAFQKIILNEGTQNSTETQKMSLCKPR